MLLRPVMTFANCVIGRGNHGGKRVGKRGWMGIAVPGWLFSRSLPGPEIHQEMPSASSITLIPLFVLQCLILGFIPALVAPSAAPGCFLSVPGQTQPCVCVYGRMSPG